MPPTNPTITAQDTMASHDRPDLNAPENLKVKPVTVCLVPRDVDTEPFAQLLRPPFHPSQKHYFAFEMSHLQECGRCRTSMIQCGVPCSSPREEYTAHVSKCFNCRAGIKHCASAAQDDQPPSKTDAAAQDDQPPSKTDAPPSIKQNQSDSNNILGKVEAEQIRVLTSRVTRLRMQVILVTGMLLYIGDADDSTWIVTLATALRLQLSSL